MSLQNILNILESCKQGQVNDSLNINTLAKDFYYYYYHRSTTFSTIFIVYKNSLV